MLGAAVAYVLAPDASRAAAHRRWVALGAASIAFHLWLVFSGLVPNLVARPLHLALALPWILLGGARFAAADGATDPPPGRTSMTYWLNVSAKPDSGRASTQSRVPSQCGSRLAVMSRIVPRGITA